MKVFLCLFVFIQINFLALENFVRASGRDLILSKTKEKVLLRGIGFSNYVWLQEDEPGYLRAMMSGNHHREEDFRRVRSMGMNSIRFLLHYKMFEQAGFYSWLDKNIAMAKKHHLYLILNLHVLPGKEAEFWSNKQMQAQVINGWAQLAKRYRKEVTIAAYDLINEPVVDKDKKQYTNFIKHLVRELRKVDQEHLLMIERLYGIGQNWATWDNPSFDQFLVDDKNVMYDFHFYYPFVYNLQGLYPQYPLGPVYPSRKVKLETVLGVMTLDKKYLRWELERWLAFGEKHNVPMNVGEFAVNNHIFANLTNLSSYREAKITDPKKGLSYLNDLLDLFVEKGLSFQYHDYHSPTYGLFYSYQVGEYFDKAHLPQENYSNHKLRALFRKKLSLEKKK